MSDPVIVCVHCDEPLYVCKAIGREYAGAQVEAEDFIPVDDSIPQPKNGDEMVCPKCGETYMERASEGGGVVAKLAGNAWWPHPPITSKES